MWLLHNFSLICCIQTFSLPFSPWVSLESPAWTLHFACLQLIMWDCLGKSLCAKLRRRLVPRIQRLGAWFSFRSHCYRLAVSVLKRMICSGIKEENQALWLLLELQMTLGIFSPLSIHLFGILIPVFWGLIYYDIPFTFSLTRSQ